MPNGGGGPMSLSQVPGSPTFRTAAVNAVAVIPLLSTDRNGHDDPTTYSSRSFNEFIDALDRYQYQQQQEQQQESSVTATTSTASLKHTPSPLDSRCVVVPNSHLTRPGDWKYDNTPLRNFHWGYGCQRLQFFDGRPYNSRMAHDRLINHQLTRDWIDLCPSRRTAALIGVLNIRDCPDQATLQKALQEWQQWAERYSTPPYEVTAHGRDFERDFVVQRLFVFDSFHESVHVNLSQVSATSLLCASSLVAFPPTDEESIPMMDLHMNVVINDLAVAIFRELEGKIRESDEVMHNDGQPLLTSTTTSTTTTKTPSTAAVAPTKSRFTFSMASSSKGGGTNSKDEKEPESPQGSGAELSLNNLASVVSPNSKLAPKKDVPNKRTVSIQSTLQNVSKGSCIKAQLLTPLDEFWDYSELNPKDAHEMMKREVARREKFAADLSLLAGSPLDAYERYTKAADLCKTACPDPLWYASALEGCAAAHIAMAEAGGFNVDGYLESSFQLPPEIMACAVVTGADKGNTKQNMPNIVFALCEDALDITSRHPRLACFHADLLLKLAWYSAEVEDVHLKCQWGLGQGCYGGESTDDKRRWEMASSTQLNFLELKTKEGEDVVARSTLKRCGKWTEVMHQAVSTGALDPVTRADVALRCASLSLNGLRRTTKPTDRSRTEERVQFHRKAAFFVIAAAEALSDIEIDSGNPDERASAMWIRASSILSKKGNGVVNGRYGWATLRAVALHAIVVQGFRESAEDAAIQLLALMGEMTPPKQSINDLGALSLEALDAAGGDDLTRTMDDSSRSDTYLDTQSYIADARSYVRERAKEVAKDARARSKELFSGQNTPSSLLTVAQSKWVEDDPIRVSILPMADFSSDFSNSVLALKAVWSTLKLDSCSIAQRRLLGQIFDLRKKSPASSLPSLGPSGSHSQNIPIEITAVTIVESDPKAALERVQTNRTVKKKDDVMATFFNPYATKKAENKATIVPLGEEQYVLITFANNLSIPFEIASCRLVFNTRRKDRIKAPAISFIIPGQTKSFRVQFPFLVLDWPNEDDNKDGTATLDIIGVHITSLSRSISLTIGRPVGVKPTVVDGPIIPNPACMFPRRKYGTKPGSTRKDGDIKCPSFEIVPPQPNLQLSFATSSTPIEDDMIIPAPLADGEIFMLPHLCLWNDSGLSGRGKIEQLRITAHGIPGLSEVTLFDLAGEKNGSGGAKPRNGMEAGSLPLSIYSDCAGIDEENLNTIGKPSGRTFISMKLSAAPNMGEQSSGCNVTIRFRYRGSPPTSNLEVWRKREVQIRVVRIKGPRMSSLTFRPDLSWDSGYSDLCKAFARRDAITGSKTTPVDVPPAGSAFDQEFVMNRLGQDPGIHVCNNEVVIMISVANETGGTIVLSQPDGSSMGFAGSPMDSLRILPGVSAKIPFQVPRVSRASDVCGQVAAMTRLKWKSEMSGSDSTDAGSTGGPMVPINRRPREGILEIPSVCMKNIADENPIFLSRICEAPCSITVEISGKKDGPVEGTSVALGKPVDVSIEIELAKWLTPDLLEQTNLTLEYFCCRQNCARNDGDGDEEVGSAACDYVWIGQIRKGLQTEGNSSSSTTGPHRARLIFLQEGVYYVSACVSFSRVDNEDEVKEVWWAAKAAKVHVLRSRQ